MGILGSVLAMGVYENDRRFGFGVVDGVGLGYGMKIPTSSLSMGGCTVDNLGNKRVWAL